MLKCNMSLLFLFHYAALKINKYYFKIYASFFDVAIIKQHNPNKQKSVGVLSNL